MSAAFQMLSGRAAKLGRLTVQAIARFAQSIQRRREERARMEMELHQARFTICSKGDDDIPLAS